MSENCMKHNSGKLERLINSIKNLFIPDNMVTEVKKKNLLVKYLQYLKNCLEVQAINKSNNKCKKCNWSLCQCGNVNEDPLNFTQVSKLFPNMNEKDLSRDQVWAKAPRSLEESEGTKNRISTTVSLTHFDMTNVHQNLKLSECVVSNKNEKYMDNPKKKPSLIQANSPIEIYKQPIKMYGGGRPKKVKAPKLRVVSCENDMISTISTIIRSLNHVWGVFDNHKKCQMKDDFNCTFCAVRSLSIRLNQPKREASVRPYELLMQEQIFDNTGPSDMLEATLQQLLLLTSSSNKEFMRNINCNNNCSNCVRVNQLSNQLIIKIEGGNNVNNIENILQNHVGELQFLQFLQVIQKTARHFFKHRNIIYIL